MTGIGTFLVWGWAVEGIAYKERVPGERGDGYPGRGFWEERGEDAGGPGARGDDQTGTRYYYLRASEPYSGLDRRCD